jgi:hypothetical protein
VIRLVKTQLLLPPHLLHGLGERAAKEGCTKSELMRRALAAFMAPDSSTNELAAMGRRLDRQTSQLERQQRDLTVLIEAFRQFLRWWLMAAPPLSDAARAAADAMGRERYERFIEVLVRRLSGGHLLVTELQERRGEADNDDAAPD